MHLKIRGFDRLKHMRGALPDPTPASSAPPVPSRPTRRRCNLPARILGSLAAIVLLSSAAAAQDSFDVRLAKAKGTLEKMGEKPGAVTSKYYHILFVGRRDFAEDRQKILHETRINLLNFVRKLDLKVDPDHEKLLVILLDTEKQMQEFTRRVGGGGLTSDVAGYYTHDQNWAVFYNQRKDTELIAWEKWLTDMADQLVKMPGGSHDKVVVNMPSGQVTLTKKELARQMTEYWKKIHDSIADWNTTVTQHEGAHQLAFNVGIQHRESDYPFWVSEGLACMFETPPKDGQSVRGAGLTNKSRLTAYRKLQKDGRTLGLKKLMLVAGGLQPGSADTLYPESWAAFTFLFQKHPKELSAYLAHLAEAPPTETPKGAKPPDPVKEFEQFFKNSVEELEKEQDAFIAKMK